MEDGGAAKLLLAWTRPGDVTSVWTAAANLAGTLEQGPDRFTQNTVGRYSGLIRLPRIDRAATLLARYRASPDAIQQFRVPLDRIAPFVALTDVAVLADGSFRFTITGTLQQNYHVEVSTNLVTWEEIKVVEGQASPVVTTLPAGPRSRFVRVRAE